MLLRNQELGFQPGRQVRNHPLTYVMNNLSRGLGLADAYPFVLSPTVIEKLHFIYDTINESRFAAVAPTEKEGPSPEVRAA